MKLFGRKNRKGSQSSAADSTPQPARSNRLPLAHRITRDLEQAQTLATMLAHSRAARVVEVADLLAGMYIYDWERLSQVWEDQDEIETFLQQICRISPQRWHHWIQDYDEHRYHQVTDEYSPSMDFRGNATLARFGFILGWKASEMAAPLGWQPGDEFAAARKGK